jgi:hypothetical protein
VKDRFWTICAVALLATTSVFARDLSDEAFAKACPSDAAWMSAQKEAKPHVAEQISNAPLRAEINKRFDADQAARNAITAHPADKSLVANVNRIDQSNLMWLRQQIQDDGFPSVAEVGHKGIFEIFMLIQHADRDRALQTKALKLMEPLVDSNEVSKMDVAFLTDRILVAEGRPQRYGTQFGADEQGRRTLKPVEDPANLDKRRASMGLEPENDYKCRMDFIFGK